MRSIAKLVAAAVVAGVLLFSSPAEARRHHHNSVAEQKPTDAQVQGLQVPMEAIYQSEFVSFMKKFDKEYTADEFFMRYNIFKANYDFIQKHNAEADAGKHTFRTGLNPMSDLTLAEFSRMNTHKPSGRAKPTLAEWKAKQENLNGGKPMLGRPDYVDLRQNGLVTNIKNQAQCGSCWAFSACASMEGAHAKAGKGLISLSEQQLLDCAPNGGCQAGGAFQNAFDYASSNGMATNDAYPYTAQQGSCQGFSSSAGFSGQNDLPQDEGAIADQVGNNNVVSVAIDASTQAFQNYHSGIFTGDCTTATDHAVAIVGYGWDQPSGKNFWIVKNSWDTVWGDQGYIWMERDVNLCGINSDAAFPNSN